MRFTIEAYGEGLTYQWQVSTNGGASYGNSEAGGYNTASMTVELQDHNPGYLYRCKVSDSAGNVVYSEPGMIRNGQISWDFTYDANGLRTKRTNGTTTYNYIYNGSQLTKMTVNSYMLNFAYDVDGKPAYVVYDGTKYFYMTNLQGDVVAIADKNGNVLVEYTYDAWGNILSTTGSMASTLGKYNPLRYRGYVYDQESSLYYYYDPALGRFINADAFTSTGQGVLGNNMFAYCGNNPSNRYDPTGYAFSDIFAVCFGGAGSPDVDVLTDGSPGSESLAEYVQNYIIPDNAVATSINVTQNANRYYHVNTSTCVGTAATYAGGALLVATMAGTWAIGAFPACAPYVAPVLACSGPIGNAITAVGAAATVIGTQAALPDGSYEEYSVVASWTTVTHPIGFPNVSIYTTHSLTARYVWNYGSPDIPPYWYLLDYMYDSSSRTYGY